jgi:hypothetical protein
LHEPRQILGDALLLRPPSPSQFTATSGTDNFSGADMEHQPHSVTFGMRTLTDPEAVSSSRHF